MKQGKASHASGASASAIPSAEDRRDRRLMGCLIVFAVVVVGLVLLVTLTVTLWRNGHRRRLDQEIARLKAEGVPTLPAEMEALYQLPAGKYDRTQDWLQFAKRLTAAQVSTEGVPIVGDAPEPPVPGASWPERASVEAYLRQVDELRQDLYELAGDEQAAVRYPIRFDQGYMITLEHLPAMRGAARLLSLDAQLAAHRGEQDRVVQDILAIWNISELLANEPSLISQLMRSAILQIGIDDLEKLMPHMGLRDEQVSRLAERLDAMSFQGMVRGTMDCERAMALISFSDPQLLSMDFDGVQGGLIRFSSEAILAEYLNYMAEVAAATELEVPAALVALELIEARIANAARQPWYARWNSMAAARFLPSYSSCVKSEGKVLARQRAMRAALAAEMHRRQLGTWPIDWNQLVPKYLDAVPIDPFTGAPLKLIVDHDHLRVYSLGEDLVDQGGAEAQEDIGVKLREPASASDEGRNRSSDATADEETADDGTTENETREDETIIHGK